jgi:hypothetical protein
MLWYNIVLVIYEILTYCGLNVNRLHKHARAAAATNEPSRAKPSWVVAWRGVASKRAMRVVSCRVVSCMSAGAGWFCHLGWLRGRGTSANVEELLRVSYHPLRWWLLVITSTLRLPDLSSITFPPVSLLPHASQTTPSSGQVASEYSPFHPLWARSVGEQASGTGVRIGTPVRVCAGDRVFGERLRDCSPSSSTPSCGVSSSSDRLHLLSGGRLRDGTAYIFLH